MEIVELEPDRPQTAMSAVKRRKNFTEKEKSRLYELVQEFQSILESKKTDAKTIEAKREAWSILTNKYNRAAETGPRTARQLHALYDNLKKKAKSTSTPTPTEDNKSSEEAGSEGQRSAQVGSASESNKEEVSVITSSAEDTLPSSAATRADLTPRPTPKKRQRNAPASSAPADPLDPAPAPGTLHEVIVKRNIQKQKYENIIASKKLQILEIQMQQELLKLEKDKVSLDAEINLKQMLIQSAKLDVELKKRNLSRQLDTLASCSDYSV